MKRKDKKFSILVAEDDPNDQFFILRAFEASEIVAEIQMVSSGKEAIAYLKGEGKFADREHYQYPSFLLTDLKMPDGDGFSILAFLQTTPQSAIVPTVVLSASDDLDDIKKSYMLGASAYLRKPQETQELQQLIRVVVEFWMACEIPEVDVAGKRLWTESRGKLAERFSK